ncbi:MAG: hypothetical protein ACOX6E_06585 [Syntrophomonadaceae bacterium]
MNTVVINLRQLRWLLLLLPLLLIFLFIQRYTTMRIEKEPLVPPETKNLYGEFYTWDEARKFFPKYSSATVIDMETRKQFNIQRRGGSSHADVQPLTAEDTAIMKSIYGEKWSWKRRAVVIVLESGLRIAGSMNGMPHGQGGIADNKFNGHFCIHFRDSKTHGSGKVDLAHQMMVWKAAGVLPSQIKNLEPEDTIRLLFTAIDQNELKVAARLLNDNQSAASILELFKEYDYVRTYEIEELTADSFEVSVLLGYQNGSKQYRQTIPVKIFKTESGWKIKGDTIALLLPKPDKQ